MPRRVRYRGLLALAALALLACGAPAEAPAARPTGPTAQAVPATMASPAPTVAPVLRRFELPTSTLSATVAPLWVAVDQGIFARYGFEIEVTGVSPPVAMQALQSGSAPFATTASTTVAAYAAGVRDQVFIAGLLNKGLFQLVAQPEIARVEELRGKAVGSSAPSVTATILLGEVLRLYGLEPERDVSILYLRDQPGILGGLLSGGTAAGFLASPYNKQARDAGYRLLLDTADLDLEILGLNLTTTRALLERERDTARRLLMAYVEGLQVARHEPTVVVESIMRGTRNEDRALAEESYALLRKVWSPWPSVRALQTLIDHTDVPGAREVRPEAMIDDSLLRELEASGWLAQHLTPP